MADPKRERNGPCQTNWAVVEPGFSLALGYELVPFNQTRVTATGLHKVLAVVPLEKDSAAPSFLGRWDAAEKVLDFDFSDREGRVPKGKRSKRAFPHGHHPIAFGEQRFKVELGPNATQIVFSGIVQVALGFEIITRTAVLTITGSPARLTHGKPATGEHVTRVV